MIPIFYIEDLTIDEIDDLVERGVVFDVTYKATLLSENRSNLSRDAFWSDGDKCSDSV